MQIAHWLIQNISLSGGRKPLCFYALISELHLGSIRADTDNISVVCGAERTPNALTIKVLLWIILVNQSPLCLLSNCYSVTLLICFTDYMWKLSEILHDSSKWYKTKGVLNRLIRFCGLASDLHWKNSRY